MIFRRSLRLVLIASLAAGTLHAGPRDLLQQPDAWFAGAEAATAAAKILSYQSGYGGWPKNVDLTAPPFAGSREDLVGALGPNLDEGTTTDAVRFLAKMVRATKDQRYLRAVEEGVDYILVAQNPTGGWPPSWPADTTNLHTVNDEATAQINALLREVAASETFGFLDAARRASAESALQRGTEKAAWRPKARIALAGDSTVTDSSGWGFGFKKKIAANVLCENFARGGQSSKSFRDTGWWDKLIAAKPDYVLIQFGHNDMPGKGANRETDPATTFAENLTRYVAEARAIGAKPVLVTSLTRRIFDRDGTFRNELAPYVEATRKVAAEQKVPLIDLHALSRAWVTKLGPAGVAPFEPKVLPKVPAPNAAPEPKLADVDFPDSDKSRRDGTHLNPRGSIEFGAVVADEFRRVLPEVGAFLR